jgi:hypothetical protein
VTLVRATPAANAPQPERSAPSSTGIPLSGSSGVRPGPRVTIPVGPVVPLRAGGPSGTGCG